MVRSGAATLLPTGYVEVKSQTADDLTYTVNGSCPCPDAQHRAPSGHCKHLLAAWLVRRVHGVTPPAPETPAPAEPVPALPEAPASVNCHITVEGRQVQVTLRDTDETRLLGRLAALLRQYPQAETQQSTPQPNGPHKPGWCVKHGVQMRYNQKAGRFWYAHRLPDGTWCNNR
jgi:hypothetical protein